VSYLVEQLPHCDLLRLSPFDWNDLSCQLDKSFPGVFAKAAIVKARRPRLCSCCYLLLEVSSSAGAGLGRLAFFYLSKFRRRGWDGDFNICACILVMQVSKNHKCRLHTVYSVPIWSM